MANAPGNRSVGLATSADAAYPLPRHRARFQWACKDGHRERNVRVSGAPVSTRRRLLRAALGLAGLVFVGIALARAVDRSRGVPLPSAWSLVAAALLTALGLVAAAGSWGVLLGPRGPSLRRLAPGFLQAQLGKYVPGAVWQAVGQVESAERLGPGVRRTVAAFAVSALVQLAAAATLGALVALAPVGGLVRLGALGGLIALVLLDRRPLAWAVARLRPAAADALPVQAALRPAFLLALVPQLAFGAAFALLLAGTDAGGLGAVPWWTAPAASLAWAAGFVVVPLPAGLGVREAVLLAALGGRVDAAAILSASLALRLASIVAELACWLVSRPLTSMAAGWRQSS